MPIFAAGNGFSTPIDALVVPNRCDETGDISGGGAVAGHLTTAEYGRDGEVSSRPVESAPVTTTAGSRDDRSRPVGRSRMVAAGTAAGRPRRLRRTATNRSLSGSAIPLAPERADWVADRVELDLRHQDHIRGEIDRAVQAKHVGLEVAFLHVGSRVSRRIPDSGKPTSECAK